MEHLFEQTHCIMDAQLQHPAPLPRPRVGSRASAVDNSDDAATSSTLINRSNRFSSDSMPPPSIPISASTPNCCMDAGDTDPEDALQSRPSRSTSSASRSNRLSLTLPIAPPNAFPTRPMPSSSTAPSFPATPVDIPSALASPSEPADFITAIAAQERRVLEIREELLRAEGHLSKLKKQFQSHEVQRKRAEIRRTEQLRPLAGKPPMASPATDVMPLSAAATDSSATDSADSAESKRSAELDRRKALLLQQSGSGPSTPVQSSKRRVFTGGRHTRALSLLSPTKTEGFNVLEDQIEIDAVRSPAPSQGSDSPFCQNLGRYTPVSASQLPKRASWAPQSVHQASGLKQVAGDLTATLWTFVEDLRQATVGDEPINGRSSAMRTLDSNSRSCFSVDGDQHTIRASSHAAARPNASRAFDADRQASPTPSARNSGSFEHKSREHGASNSGSSNGAKLSRSGSKKSAKRFSWTPLTMDSYDDSEWSSWDSPTTTVNAKSPRWSGSTMAGDTAATIPEQADENTMSLLNASTSSPSTPSKGNDLTWPTALNQLVPGNIKRMGTDLIKELEKGLAIAVEPGMVGDVVHDAHA